MLLAIDTATRNLSLALHSGDRLLAEHTWHTANFHTVELAPQVAAMLQRAEAPLTAIALTIGPGSYTGLRIGLAFAKGLALAQKVPLIGVETFDVVMHRYAQAPRPEIVFALVNAGRGRVSLKAYRWTTDRWQLQGDTRLLTWENLAAAITEPTFVCGEVEPAGIEFLRQVKIPVRWVSPAQATRRAGDLAEIGWARLRAGQLDDVTTLAPIYGGGP
jgi:tRNA threonylcarbamoyladenosine biosynthesis protein TsaB